MSAHHRATLIFSFILLLAAALRLLNLTQTPPGLWFDEAWVAVQAHELGSASVGFPLYFPGDFGGMHPAIVYLTALSARLLNYHPYAIRYATAAAALFGLVLAYGSWKAIWRLEKTPPTEQRLAPLFSAFILAITFPYLILTRIGFEPVFPVMPAALAFWGLAQAIRTQKRAYYLLTGCATGLAFYAHNSGRFVPIAITCAILWLLLIGQERRPLIRGWLLITITALVVASPLLLYFLQHSDLFLSRAAVTSYNTLGPGSPSVPLALATNLFHTLMGLFWPGFGDALTRHNLPGRPVFDPFLAVLLGVGMLYLARHPRWQHSALLISWASAMLIPVILTDGAPTYTRLMGALPALAAIAGEGAVFVYTWLKKRTPWAGIVVALGLMYSLGVTTGDYFGRWREHPGLFEAFQVGEWQAATLAQTRLVEGPVYLAPDMVHLGRPTFALLLRGRNTRPFTGPTCLPYENHPTRPLTYVIDASQAQATAQTLAHLFPTALTETVINPNDGDTLFNIVTIPTGAAATPPTHAVQATFGPLTLVGYDLLAPTLTPGSTITVRLYWQNNAPIPGDNIIFLHLYPAGTTEAAPLSQHDSAPCAGSYPTTRWQNGESILDDHPLTLPPDSGNQDLLIAVGVYTWPSLERLSLTPAPGALSDNRFVLTTLTPEP
ncbi:MAG: glycosyltransferase family 39 protein [Chloroflexi bacterium]|nr:glycosyltransferase family 39 protein [Chloroflexota bacterium]